MSALGKQKIVHVGDESYVITPFLTSKGLRIKHKLVKYLGTSLEKALVASEQEEDKESTLLGIIAEVFMEIPEDQYIELIKDVLSNVTKNGMSVDFDKEFALNYANLFKLLKEVIEFNYNDLFSALGISVG